MNVALKRVGYNILLTTITGFEVPDPAQIEPGERMSETIRREVIQRTRSDPKRVKLEVVTMEWQIGKTTLRGPLSDDQMKKFQGLPASGKIYYAVLPTALNTGLLWKLFFQLQIFFFGR